MHEQQQQQFDKIPHSFQPINKKSELMTSSEETFEEYATTTTDYETSTADMNVESSDIFANVATVIPWELIQQNADLEKQILTPPDFRAHAMPVIASQKLTAISLRADEVRVVIHNITQLTEDDVQQRGHMGETTMADNLYDEDINEKL